MEPDGDSPPFWPPTSTSVPRHRRRSPPSFISPVILILLLPILALLLIFFVIYPFLSHTAQFLLGSTFSVKKSWDSLNVVLVIFAILCGVFARRKEEVPPVAAGRNTRSSIGDRPAEPVLSSHYLNSRASVGPETETARSSHYVYNTINTSTFQSENETVSSNQWYDTSTTPVRPEIEAFRNGPWYDATSVRPDIDTIPSSQYWYNYNTSGVGPENQLRRRSSSYPDLRQESIWNDGESRFRFDDLGVNVYNQLPAETPPVSDQFDGDGRRGKEDGEDPDDKVIPVDTFEVRSTSPPKSTPPPSPPPEPPLDFMQQQSFDNVQREEEDEKPRVVETNADDDDQLKENRSPLPAPPPPPPEPPVSLKQHRSFHSMPRKKKVAKQNDVEAEMADDQSEEKNLPPPAPAPAKMLSPPLSPDVQKVLEESHPKLQRKKSGTAKELTNAISSFYNQQKKKKKSKKKFAEESSSESSPHSTHSLPPQTPPPPPPPLPPPFKGFQNLFKKSSKSKRSQYSETSETTHPPPPPPPPPPNSIFNNIFKTGNRSKRFIPTSSPSGPPPPPPPPPSSILNTLFKQGSISNRFKSESSINKPPPPPPPPKPHVSSKRKSKNRQAITPTPPAESTLPGTTTSGKPPLPAKSNTYSDDFLNSGSQSPLITKPPPLPPFTMAEFEFVASGDFVRIRSSIASSSWCSSPGLEDVDDVTDQMDGSDPVGPSVSCPSPDVNVKADTFISRLKDEWRLEKMNSIRKNPLGPSPSN